MNGPFSQFKATRDLYPEGGGGGGLNGKEFFFNRLGDLKKGEKFKPGFYGIHTNLLIVGAEILCSFLSSPLLSFLSYLFFPVCFCFFLQVRMRYLVQVQFNFK